MAEPPEEPQGSARTGKCSNDFLRVRNDLAYFEILRDIQNPGYIQVVIIIEFSKSSSEITRIDLPDSHEN